MILGTGTVWHIVAAFCCDKMSMLNLLFAEID